MWENDLSKITLLDVLDANDVSVRTSNCIKSAIDEGLLSISSIRTVKNYIHAGDMAMVILNRLPNMGRKSVGELDNIIHEVFEAGGMDVFSMEALDEGNDALSDVMNLRLSEIVESNISSERLKNSILQAEKDGALSIETVGEYVQAGKSALRTMLQIQSFGNKTAYELDALIKDVIDFSNKGTCVYEGKELPAGLSSLKISEMVKSHLISERLRNSILQAEDDDALPLLTLCDYVKAGDNALRIMQKVPCLGKKTAAELDHLIKGVLDNPDTCKVDESVNVKETRAEGTELEMDVPGTQERLLKIFQNILSEREYGVLKHRAIDGKTLEESGEIYDVTRERIRQIEKKAKIKLLKAYRNVFNQVVNKIDKILDDSYGEVSLVDAASALSMNIDILKLLVSICSDQCIKPIRVRRGYLFRPSTENNHSEWNETIDEVLYSLKWPINIGEVYEGLQDIPHSYVDRYLEKNRGAKIDGDVISELRKIPRAAMIVYVFRDAGHALHSSEIARRYSLMFGKGIQEHNAQTVVARMDEALIVERGVYSLYEFLDVSEEIIDKIRHRAYDFIKNEEKYVSSKVLYEELFKNNADYQGIDNAYIIHGILQDDERFSIRRGLMVGIKGHDSFVEFKPLTDEVHELVESKGPLSASEILKAISGHRKILSVSVSKILENSGKIIRVSPGRYDTITNVFGESHLVEDLELAIQIALSDHDQSLFELISNIRSLEMTDGIEITKSILSSILGLMHNVMRKGEVYSINSIDKSIITYNAIINSIHQTNLQMELQEEVEKQLGSELAKQYIAVDYRIQSNGGKASTDEMGLESTSEISSILSAFGV